MQNMKKLILLVIYLFIHPILVKSQGTFGCDGIIGTPATARILSRGDGVPNCKIVAVISPELFFPEIHCMFYYFNVSFS